VPTAAYLTKSRYAAGLQCLRRLWLNVHEVEAWDELQAGSPDDIGLEIGRMAHLLFPVASSSRKSRGSTPQPSRTRPL
jgi:hypothetical protein